MTLAAPPDLGTSADLVRQLLAAQAPALADLPVRGLARGRDTDSHRLGEGLLVRLPRRERAVALLEQETTWLPVLGSSLTAPTPQPVFVGTPSDDFPHPWAVVTFIPGTPVSELPVAERTGLAEDLADFLWSLQAPAPGHAPVNPERGGSLATEPTDSVVRERLARLARDGGGADRALAENLLPRWEAWVAAPDFDGVDQWLHGDLHPRHLVADPGGRLAGVLDWSELTIGDPACDLATAWLTFDEAGRRAFCDRVNLGGQVDAPTWTRAKAWALHLGLGLLGLGLLAMPDDEAGLRAIGRHALEQLAAERD